MTLASYCPFCGLAVPDKVIFRFCPQCGNALPKVVSSRSYVVFDQTEDDLMMPPTNQIKDRDPVIQKQIDASIPIHTHSSYPYGSLTSKKLESQEIDNSLRIPNHSGQSPIQNSDSKSPWVYKKPPPQKADHEHLPVPSVSTIENSPEAPVLSLDEQTVAQDLSVSTNPQPPSNLALAEPPVAVESSQVKPPANMPKSVSQNSTINNQSLAVDEVPHRKRILLVEDDEAIHDMYMMKLQTSGYQIDSAKDGRLARELIVRYKYDLILLDLMLPFVNGLELLQEIKKIDFQKQSAIIIFTNLDNDDMTKQCLALGADLFLVKANTTPKELLRKTEELFLKKEMKN